jgi:uncharacterized protein (TIGR02301 family)
MELSAQTVATCAGHRSRGTVLFAVMLMVNAIGFFTPAAMAASGAKPYDDRLFRLSEILGAVHYLRELCGANEGQYLRDRMHDLMEAE